MQITQLISSTLVQHYKALPIVLMVLVWWFFAGSRHIMKKKSGRIHRELLFCLSVFGIGFGLLNFVVYGLVDPANGLARPGALPVPPEDFLRFERSAYASLAVAVLAFLALEYSLKREAREKSSA